MQHTCVPPLARLQKSDYALGCYARYDAGFNAQSCLDSWNPASPCWASQEPDCTSAVSVPVSITTEVFSRDFEHLHVEFNEKLQTATLQWS